MYRKATQSGQIECQKKASGQNFNKYELVNNMEQITNDHNLWAYKKLIKLIIQAAFPSFTLQ